jgi:hypothetical protein
MPGANSVPILSNQIAPYPSNASGATAKPKLLDLLRKACAAVVPQRGICLSAATIIRPSRNYWATKT